MTVICAVTWKGKGAIAWDSRITGGGKGIYSRKVFRCGFGWAGVAGGLRELQLLERAWASLEHADTQLELMHLADLAYKAIPAFGKAAESSLDLDVLILTNSGRIWHMDSALAVVPHAWAAAVGAGAEAALGALYALKARGLTDPRALAQNAARAATRLVEGCGGPVRVRTV